MLKGSNEELCKRGRIRIKWRLRPEKYPRLSQMQDQFLIRTAVWLDLLFYYRLVKIQGWQIETEKCKSHRKDFRHEQVSNYMRSSTTPHHKNHNIFGHSSPECRKTFERYFIVIDRGCEPSFLQNNYWRPIRRAKRIELYQFGEMRAATNIWHIDDLLFSFTI